MKKLWAAVLTGLLGCSSVCWAADPVAPGTLVPLNAQPSPYPVLPTLPSTVSNTSITPPATPPTTINTKSTVKPAVAPTLADTKPVVASAPAVVPDAKAIGALAGCCACTACAPVCATCNTCVKIPKCGPCNSCVIVSAKPCATCTTCLPAPKPCTTCTTCTCGHGFGNGKLLDFFSYHQPLTPLGECGADIIHPQLYTFFLDKPCRPTWKPVACCDTACGTCNKCGTGCGSTVVPLPTPASTPEVLPAPVPVMPTIPPGH